jgi:hypothetical protein
MGAIRKKNIGKWAKIAVVLLLAVFVISGYFWITVERSNSGNYDERYKDVP